VPRKIAPRIGNADVQSRQAAALQREMRSV
jgi:hypothetical protein